MIFLEIAAMLSKFAGLEIVKCPTCLFSRRTIFTRTVAVPPASPERWSDSILVRQQGPICTLGKSAEGQVRWFLFHELAKMLFLEICIVGPWNLCPAG